MPQRRSRRSRRPRQRKSAVTRPGLTGSSALLLLMGMQFLLPMPVLAGTICGLVRDVETGDPIERAGVFVHQPGGGYTGHHGATDFTGTFCIEGIPPGTYDLSVQVDSYQVAWSTGVIVEDPLSEVVLDVKLPAIWLWPPWPNPTQGRVSIRLTSRIATPLKLAIYDVSGRLVRGWQAYAGASFPRTFTWDGRDHDGRLVPSGRYLLRLRSGDLSLTRRLLVLR